ncbi:putative multi-domain containing protein [Aduncisulcus paluster]|uniref:Multi-domain containing protein n=1 Tax=Aduncisulcus paluster TaxID=2918883 RepID=A0ABQ5KXD2_9EUKA|nr:putative multi-domain containing protein [Aduncisulcus paluster]
MTLSGGSIIAIKYKGGVMMTADTLLSFGRMARYRGFSRIRSFGDNTLISFTGDHADFTTLMEEMEKEIEHDVQQDDGVVLNASEIHTLLTRILYHHRSDMKPKWTYLIVAGSDKDGKSFLGYIDLYGTHFECDYTATGYAEDLALPMIRREWNPEITEDQAAALLQKCVKVCVARDCKQSSDIQFAKVSETGTSLSRPVKIDCDWSVASYKEIE